MNKRIRAIALLVTLLSLYVPMSFAAQYPQPTNNFYVNDFAGILSAETEQSIMDASVPLAQQTGAQIVVVTIDTMDGQDIETYANTLFREWGIGDAKKNNGLLLLIAYEDHQSRIEVGYGLEGALNDAKTGRIQDDYLIGNFQAGDYDAGVLGTYYKLTEEVYKEYDLNAEDLVNRNVYYSPTDSTDTNESDDFSISDIFIGFIVLIFIFIDLIFNRGRMTRFIFLMLSRGGRGGGGGGYSGGGGSRGGGGSSRSW